MTGTGKTLRLGVAGLGTVGGGLLKLIERQAELRIPGKLEVVAVSARNKTRNRGVDISKFRWADDPMELATASDIDVIVELIGGSDGPAKRTVEAALGRANEVARVLGIAFEGAVAFDAREGQSQAELWLGADDADLGAVLRSLKPKPKHKR